MSGFTDEMRARMTAINAGIGHVRRSPSGTKYLKYTADGQPFWDDTPSRPEIVKRSMFPYCSTQMACEPKDVPAVQEHLRSQGVFAEFDREGRPIVTSTKQHDALAKAMGMKTGRDGYGHTDEHGRFQNTGRRRAAEIQEGRAKTRRAIQELEAMPEEAPAGAVAGVLDEYNILPTEENTG